MPADGDRHTRLWRYALSRDPARSGLLTTDFSGEAAAVEAYETKTADVRGVLAATARAGTWTARRAARAGTGRCGARTRRAAGAPECGSDETRHCWSGGSGSLSYWEATGEVWSQSGRMLFALPLTSIDRALD